MGAQPRTRMVNHILPSYYVHSGTVKLNSLPTSQIEQEDQNVTLPEENRQIRTVCECFFSENRISGQMMGTPAKCTSLLPLPRPSITFTT